MSHLRFEEWRRVFEVVGGRPGTDGKSGGDRYGVRLPEE